jgi:NAD(P)-dependent dehydrogenase (short-subunit alcohol dehydrogenase family)
MELQGKGALVTGASRGLGAALSAELARAGARVAMVARGERELSRVAAQIRAAGGVAHALPADVGDKRAVHAIAGTAAALVGPIELLVHNASTLGPVPLRLLLDTECEDLEQVLQVNLVGPFRLTKLVAGAMALRGSGLVVHMSSDAAVAAYPRWGAYGVSKAAQDHLARTFAAELSGAGVRFLTIDPGEMDTQMHAAAMPEANRAALSKPDTVARAIVGMIRRAGRMESGARLEASSWEAR